jgi:hypothetical protein
MSALRDLYVGITLDDRASRPLRLVDREVDNVRDGFASMNREIDDSSNSFNRMGSSGRRAMGRVEESVEDATDEMSGFSRALNGIGSNFGDLTRKASNFSKISSLIATGLGGVVAAGAPAVAGVGALGASFASAGIGAAAFGAVATSAIGKVVESSEEVAKIEAKIANADSAEKRIEAQKELSALYANMSKEQEGALKGLQKFKSFWSDFTKQFETPIFKAFGKSLTLAQNVLKGFAPTITKVSGVVNQLFTEMNDAAKSGGMKDFFSWLEGNAAGSLYNFAHIAGNAFAGIFNLFQAFSPLMVSVEEGLYSATKSFKDWSSSLSGSTGFQQFIDYVKTNGPTLVSTLGNVGGIIGDVTKALAPLGTIVLNAANEFTNFIQTSETIQAIFDGIASFGTMIQENWGPVKEIVIGATTAFVAFKGIMAGMTIIGAINTLMTAWKAGTVAQTLAQWGLNTAMLANPITWVVAGIASLIAIGVLLWRNWDTVKAKAGELWDYTKSVFGKFSAYILEKLKPVISFFTKLKDTWDSFKSSISNFKMPKIGLPKWMGGNGLIQTDGSHATGLERVPYDGYTATVHEDEAILTAKQSNALRDAGILKSNSGKPALDMQASSSDGGQVETQQSSPVFQFYIGGENSKDIAQEVRKEVENIFAGLNLST